MINSSFTKSNELEKLKPKLVLAWGYAERPLLAVLIFLAFVVSRYIQIGARREILATIRFEFLLGIVVIIISIFLVVRKKPCLFGVNALMLLILSLFLVMASHVPFAADQEMALLVFNDKAIKFMLFAFSMIVMIESPRHLRWFIYAFLFSLFYITFESFKGLISGGLYWQNQGILRLHGAVPLYAHPNSLGGVSLGVVPYIFYLWSWAKSKKIKLCFIATLVTSLTCVMYSGSRTSYLGLLSFLILAWVLSNKKVKALLISCIVFLVVLNFIPEQYVDRFKSIGGEEAEGNSKETRIEILYDAMAILQDAPFGVGVASFPAVRMERFKRYQNTHNLYLEVATNLGIHGLLVFLALIYEMIRQMRNVVGRSDIVLSKIKGIVRKDPRYFSELEIVYNDVIMIKALALATIGFIVIRLIVGFFGMDLYEVYWWFGAGIAVVLSRLIHVIQVRIENLVTVSRLM